MKYFYLAALFAAMQILLLSAVIYLLNRNKIFLSVVFIIIKFAAYVYGISALFALETSPVVHGVVGFLAGLPISGGIFMFILYRLKRRKS